jgi:hypothetical protein
MAQSPFAQHVRHGIKSQLFSKTKGTLTPDERKGLRGPKGTYGAQGVPHKGFGSAGVQPKRNPAFTSDIGFSSWKSKHPKSAYTGGYEDIDGDDVDEFVVKRGEDVYAVNGWELHPSRWKYEQRGEYAGADGQMTGLWKARASINKKFKEDFIDEDMKGIFSGFGKSVVKPVFAVMFPTGKSPEVKGKERTASWFYKGVARVLIGNALDDEMIAQGADVIAQRWGGVNADTLPAIKSVLHRSKQYKQEFKRRLLGYDRTLYSDQGRTQFVPEVAVKVRQAIDAVGELGGAVEGEQIAAPDAVVEAVEGVPVPGE